MKNKTELLSFLNPDKTYSADEVSRVIVDLEVISNTLQGTTSNGETIPLGQWSGDLANDLVGLTVDPVKGILISTKRDKKEFETPKFIDNSTTAAAYRSKGLHIGREEYSPVNPVKDDYFNESQGLYYTVEKDPETITAEDKHVITANGTDIKANVQWSAGYTVYNTLNRKVDFVSDGLLGTGAGLTLTHTYTTPIRLVGHNYKNLRTDYRTAIYRIEYSPDGIEWIFYDRVDLGAQPMDEIISTKPEVSALAVRWVAESWVNAPGIGMFNVLSRKAGIVEIFEDVEFHADFFDVVESENDITVTPSTGPAALISLSPGTDPLGILHYARLTANFPPHQGRYSARTHVSTLNINTIERDSLGITPTFPGFSLPPGDYMYRITHNAPSGSDASSFFLTFAGMSEVPLDKQFFIGGHVRSNSGAGQMASYTGQFCLTHAADLAVKAKIKTQTISPPTLVDGSPETIVEIWRTSETPNFVPMTVPARPAEGMISANWFPVEELMNTAASSDLLTNGIITGEAGLDLTVASHFFRFFVREPFRIWVASSVVSAPAKLYRIAAGEVLMSYGIEEIAPTENTWQRWTGDLPPGEYVVKFDSARRADREWFVEYVETPQYIPEVLTNIVLPMTQPTDQGQITTESSSYSANHKAWKACGVGPDYDGWTTSLGVNPSVATPEWMVIEFISGPQTITGYSVSNRGHADHGRVEDFTLQGWNTETNEWDILHTVVGRTDYAVNQETRYEDIGPFTYAKYRLHVTSMYSNPGYMSLGQFKLFRIEKPMRDNWL